MSNLDTDDGNFSFLDYDNTDIAAAVKAVTGDTVVYTSVDDEHVFWFLVEDEAAPITYDNVNAEWIDELYSGQDIEDIMSYLKTKATT